jgi:hypothetical protein
VQIAGSNGKSDPFTKFFALLLIGCGCTQGGVEGQIDGFPVGWSRLDVAAAFAVSSSS